MSDLQEYKITNIIDAEAASPTMGFGFGKKTKAKELRNASKRPRTLPKLTKTDLRNDAKLLDWYNTLTQRKNSLDTDCHVDLLNIFCAAERALEHGDDPPALFVFIVTGKRWELITNEQEDRALQHIRRLRHPEREAQRRRGRDDDDTGKPSEPLAVGDIIRDAVSAFLQNASTAACSKTASCR